MTDRRSELIEQAQAHFLRSENDEGQRLMAEAKALELPAKGDPGYSQAAWGERQPDGTVPTVDFVWWQGDVYHDDTPPGFSSWADLDALAWRWFVRPDEITSGKTPRFQIVQDKNAAVLRTMRRPIDGRAAKYDQTRATMRANQRAERLGQEEVVAEVKEQMPPPGEDADAIEVGDYMARMCAAIARHPDASLATMKVATDIAKSWTGMTNQRRMTKALGQVASAPADELTPEAKQALARLRNVALMAPLEQMTRGEA